MAKHFIAIVWGLTLLFAPAASATEPTPKTVLIPAGHFIQGSNRAEREAAYLMDEAAYGHSITRKNRWYENEGARSVVRTGAYDITLTPVTNAQYAVFVQKSGRPPPNVDRATWRGYGLIHPWSRTRRHAWKDGRTPPGRADHPVVLVSHDDAEAYAAWLSKRTGSIWRLPSEQEWEKAARGVAGTRFPWGDAFDPNRLNSHDKGKFDTTPVGAFSTGASPFGVLDVAGQVFEWTATPPRSGAGRWIVKGGSWDDSGCGICRPAAHHTRPGVLKHILIGFRLVRERR
jgi:toxoflavin biosynthesis protein ToxD